MAYRDVKEFLDARDEFPPDELKKKELKELIATAEEVYKRLGWMAFARQAAGGQNRSSGGGGGGNGDDDDKPDLSELRQLIRAEKLDRFMRQGAKTIGEPGNPKVGILKLRSLASGGSRRETRNLFLGNHIAYSGSVTMEILLFDVDGRLRLSEILTNNTGFRKLKTTKEH